MILDIMKIIITVQLKYGICVYAIIFIMLGII